jgi:hypothetical protein
MAVAETAFFRSVSASGGRATRAVLGACILSLSAAGLGLLLAVAYRPPPLPLTIAAGVALLAVLGLTLVRYDAAVFLGVLLLGVILAEPAPPDAIFAVAIAVALVTGRFRVQRIPLIVGGLVGALIALNLLSAIFAVDPLRMGTFLLITSYLAAFGLWLASYVDSTARARLVTVALIAGSTASALLGTLALFLPLPGRDLFVLSERARGLFEDPNVFGPFMVVPALIVASELLEPRLLRVGRAVKVALFVVLGAGVLFSYSRAAWLNAAVAFTIMLVVYGLRRGGGRRVFRLLFTVVTALALLAVALAVTGSVAFLEERARFQTYDAQRFGAQQSGISLVERFPFGVGPGQFEQYVDISAHSLYVRLLAEQGVLGIVVGLALVITTLAFAARNVVTGTDTYGIGSATLLAAWCGLVVNSAFVDTLHWRHFWLVAALIWAATMRSNPLGQRS